MKPIFAAIAAAALFVSDQAIARAEELSPEVKAQLCREKKAGLAKIEAEAPQIRVLLPQKESELESHRAAMDLIDKAVLALESGVIPGWIQAVVGTGLDAAKAWATQQHGRHVAKVGPLRDEISRLKQRQTEVGSQIFLLRDIIEGLRCDSPPTAGSQRPPVDYDAIGGLGQQFQQSGPGESSGSASSSGGQTAQPQGSSYTTPTPGYGAPGGAAQPPQSSGGYYGYPPSYGTPSPQIPWEGVVPPSGASGGGQPKNPCGGG